MTKTMARLAMGVATALVVVGVGVTGVYRPERWRSYFRYRSDVTAIAFYGRVIAQSGEPMAGVAIVASVSTVNPRYLLGEKQVLLQRRIQLVTDANGDFPLRDIRGRHLTIESISHPGYQSVPPPDRSALNAPGQPGPWVYVFTPSAPPGYQYIPDPRNPAIFPLARKGEAIVHAASRGGRQTQVK